MKPNRIVPTQLGIVDIAGLVRGASKGEGLGNKFLANIREVDAIVHVIRCFEDENILRDEGAINPVSDKEIIDTELQLKDLESVEKKVEPDGEDAEDRRTSKIKIEYEVKLKRCKGIPGTRKESIRERNLTKEEKTAIADLFLLTDKPVLYVANVDEASMHTGNKYSEALKAAVAGEKAQVIVMNNSIEAQISEMEEPADRELFMEEYKYDGAGPEQAGSAVGL